VAVLDVQNSLKQHWSFCRLFVQNLTSPTTYASFHFSVTEDDFPHTHNTGICPDGCLVTPFYGRAQTKFLIRIHALHLDPCHLVWPSSLAAPTSGLFPLIDEADGQRR
jgi:hypothetical protein